jgi:hypothetical protein
MDLPAKVVVTPRPVRRDGELIQPVSPGVQKPAMFPVQ